MPRPTHKPLDRYRSSDAGTAWERRKQQVGRIVLTVLGLATMALAVYDASDGTVWVGLAKGGPGHPTTGVPAAIATFGMFSFGLSMVVMGVWRDIPIYVALPAFAGLVGWVVVAVYTVLM